MGRSGNEQVLSITSAPQTRSQEISQRTRHYLISMAIRTLCFIGAVAVGPGFLRWLLIGGAVLLPYFAVVMANRMTARKGGDAVESPTFAPPTALGPTGGI